MESIEDEKPQTDMHTLAGPNQSRTKQKDYLGYSKDWTNLFVGLVAISRLPFIGCI
jgi:hypothetical protein